ncbi:unnamed protein product [Phytophthora fragariaefolia]|uniref:Unnamed protein product n=1 Tax=Phytophthora fragariaefolia TaxID=1490495 RepID=A0A9W6XPY5_9STRA|nr:unnamed protein product [Phytophthora fragariaefolia]
MPCCKLMSGVLETAKGGGRDVNERTRYTPCSKALTSLKEVRQRTTAAQASSARPPRRQPPKIPKPHVCTCAQSQAHTQRRVNITLPNRRRHWRNGTLLPPSHKKKKIRARTPTDNEESRSSDESSNIGSGSHQKRVRRDVAAPTS